MEFPQRPTVAGRQLPEDFILRGWTLAQNYFPLDFFDNLNPNIKERMEERPDYVAYRAERIWYLTRQLALVSWTGYITFSTFIDRLQANRYLGYDPLGQEFSTKPL